MAAVHDVGVTWHACDVDSCEYKSKQTSTLRSHMATVHDIGVTWHVCDVDSCEYKAKRATHLRRHMAAVHDVGVTWHACDVDSCEHKAKQAWSIRQHMAAAHDIGVTWHVCDVDSCEYKTKRPGNLRTHMAGVHDVDVTWHVCDVDSCEHKAKQSGDLRRHMAAVHDVGVTWHVCDVDSCEYKAKQAGTLCRHMANVHDIGVTWHACDVDSCEYKTKQAGTLRQHMADVHDVGVTWYTCDVDSCEFKAKQAGNLRSHMAFVHDVGDHQCDYCLLNRNSLNEYAEPTTNAIHQLCKRCYKKATGQESRIETQWTEFVDAQIGVIGLLGSDRSLKSLSIGCSLKRPDRLYINANDDIELDECDERQHHGANGDYTCEEKRLTEIYDSEQISGNKMIVIRWNPDGYKLRQTNKQQKQKKKLSRTERMQLFVDLKLHLRNNPPNELIHVFYMFYDADNPHICKNIPVSHVSSRADLQQLTPPIL